MNKVEDWLQKNSIKKNENYIIEALEGNDIKNYNITQNGYGDYDVILKIMNKKYKIQIDEQAFGYNLLEFNLANNYNQKERYHLVKSFDGDNIISEVLRYIKNRNSYRLLN
ncbi:hypothetical protein [Clostridium scatologenes]|uniref:Uncharacterized protein n=1 Tax=Clostridium scatologenes TaxID=1548 RepID=A0A0E3GRE3_CLOSL|nr:hypothetical protein [Clostridium scatologenes]AKA70171.1 hypothetical protein CSCA_3046 [Clostridium scatologenes]